MQNIIKFIVHLNIVEGIDAVAAGIFVFFIGGKNILITPLLVLFFSTLFLYTLNRLSDVKEDRINYPERVYYFKKFQNKILPISLFFFLISLAIAFFNSMYSFLWLIFPFILVFAYSFFRLKRFLFLKNLIVATGWSAIPFFISTYINLSLTKIIICSIVIFISILVNTIIFDIKDTKGDKIHRIFTIPNTYGIKFTKYLCYALSFSLLVLISIFLYLKILSLNFIWLIFFPLYIFIYTYKVSPKNAIIISEYLANLDMIILSILTGISVL